MIFFLKFLFEVWLLYAWFSCKKLLTFKVQLSIESEHFRHFVGLFLRFLVEFCSIEGYWAVGEGHAGFFLLGADWGMLDSKGVGIRVVLESDGCTHGDAVGPSFCCGCAFIVFYVLWLGHEFLIEVWGFSILVNMVIIFRILEAFLIDLIYPVLFLFGVGCFFDGLKTAFVEILIW